MRGRGHLRHVPAATPALSLTGRKREGPGLGGRHLGLISEMGSFA